MQQEVRNAAKAVVEAVALNRAGRFPHPEPETIRARSNAVVSASDSERSQCVSLESSSVRDNRLMPDDAIRDHLVRVLDWEEAHVGFDKAIDGIPADKRGARAPGFEHSAWQLLEHIRLAQDDILDFCVNPKYVHTMKWPDDYWPAPEPPSGARGRRASRRSRDRATR